MKITKTAGVDKIENKQQQTNREITWNKELVLSKKINKNWQIYGNSDRVKREKTQITNIRNETVDITIDSVVIESKGILHTALCT